MSNYSDVYDHTAPPKKENKIFRIVIPGQPVAAPRMTQRDKWASRPCVVKYFNWRNNAKRIAIEQLGEIPDPETIVSLSWVAFIEPPKSWSKKRKKAIEGELHRQNPDRDNLDKSILDALFKQDQAIADGRICKRWSKTPRVEVTIEVAHD